jgi:hypothetical protein
MTPTTSRHRWLPALAIAVIGVVLATASRSPLAGPRPDGPARPQPAGTSEADGAAAPTAAAAAIDQLIETHWADAGIEPAAAAPELTVVRRAWLALAGTIPSLEEIRRFEGDPRPDRLDRAIAALLAERRSAEALARRLAPVLVGQEEGQFIVFRRDRFTSWLADQLHENRPWDGIVRDMVASRGLWTDTPAVNFITQAAEDGRINVDKLAGRSCRVFLGQRIDCAQCHDHPFAAWKQPQFEGLAACFAQSRLTGVGVEDDPGRVHTIDAMSPASLTAPMQGSRNVPPRVPFGKEWLPTAGTHRENLAAWIVHAENRRFDRAIANRAWWLLFGRAWHEPIDDLPDPPERSADGSPAADLLDLLADDFRSHGRDLRRLLTVIASTRAFRLASTHPLLDSPAGCDRVADAWAAFPLAPLLPEQVIGAMVATTSLQTIDQDSHLLTRTIRFFREIDFVREYGQIQDGNGRVRPATIPQALVRMNGKFAREMAAANAVSATGRIAGMARDDDARLDIAFLVTLTRRPTAEERTALLPLLAATPQKGQGLEDVTWTLFNCPEFCWNH